MLKIVNESGENLMTLHDNGHDEVHSQKLKEQMEEAKITESKGE